LQAERVAQAERLPPRKTSTCSRPRALGLGSAHPSQRGARIPVVQHARSQIRSLRPQNLFCPSFSGRKKIKKIVEKKDAHHPFTKAGLQIKTENIQK
jgi:hypothetical protein